MLCMYAMLCWYRILIVSPITCYHMTINGSFLLLYFFFLIILDMDPRNQKYIPSSNSAYNNNQYQFPKRDGFTKIYLGNLPVEVTDQEIRDQFEGLAEIAQLKVIRGNNNGQFSRYVFAFMEVKGDEDYTNEVIRKVCQNNVGWKINIRAYYQNAQGQGKYDNYKQRSHNSSYGGMEYKGRDHYSREPRQHTGSGGTPYIQPNFSNRLISYNQGERGIKRHKILVREIWIGGIPERISESEMREIMSMFGIVEATQIFPKFAFIKFKLVSDATTAFEKAHIIYDRFGKNSGFRIFFSDPEKRIQIVSNHYEFDRQNQYLPILFLGFPPVTSSYVDDLHMKGICEQYGPIVETYMRKSNNPQTRSYILLTYDNVKNAIRAKQELSRRKDLLGDKRVEVAVLLSEESILRGRNLQNTVERFQTPNNYEKRAKGNVPSYNPNTFQPPMQNMYGIQSYPPPSYQHYPSSTMPGGMILPPPPPGMPPPGMPSGMGSMGSMGGGSIGSMNPGMIPPSSYYPPPMGSMYYPPQYGDSSLPFNYSSETEKEEVIKILEFTLKRTDDPVIPPPPPPKTEVHEVNQKDLNNPDWSGYLARVKVPKVAVDGYSKTPNFNYEDSIFNISYLIKLSDIKFKTKKTIIVLEASSESNQQSFQENYVDLLKKKESAGVCLSYSQMIFLMPKSPQADEITEITDKQLLVVVEEIGLYHELKASLTKVEE